MLMNSLPQEIVEHIIDYACCDKFILVSEEPVKALRHTWEWNAWVEGEVGEPDYSKGGKWYFYWDEYSKDYHLNNWQN